MKFVTSSHLSCKCFHASDSFNEGYAPNQSSDSRIYFRSTYAFQIPNQALNSTLEGHLESVVEGVCHRGQEANYRPFAMESPLGNWASDGS